MDAPVRSFAFEFCLDDKYIVGIIPFIKEPIYEENDMSDMDDKMTEMCQEKYKLESKYGVHDGVAGPKYKYNNQIYVMTFGYTSYEIEENQILNLMNEWKYIFDNELGFVTGDIIIKPFEEIQL